MYEDNEIDTRSYMVVVNHEEQYSIWFVGRDLPAGWTVVDIPEQWLTNYRAENPKTDENAGNKDECLAYINEIWVDMRPLSLRKKLAEAANA